MGGRMDVKEPLGTLDVHHLSTERLPTLVHAGMVWSFVFVFEYL